MLGHGCSAVGARPWVRLQGVMDGSTGWLECLSSESVTEMRVLKSSGKTPSLVWNTLRYQKGNFK